MKKILEIINFKKIVPYAIYFFIIIFIINMCAVGMAAGCNVTDSIACLGCVFMSFSFWLIFIISIIQFIVSLFRKKIFLEKLIRLIVLLVIIICLPFIEQMLFFLFSPYEMDSKMKRYPYAWICQIQKTKDHREGCYYFLAEAKRDIYYCDKSDDRYTCYKNVAIIKKDISICEKLNNQSPELKDSCIYGVIANEKDIKSCLNLTAVKDQDQCYLENAIFAKDIKICGKIQDKKQKNICYTNLAEKLENPNICNKIIYTDTKAYDISEEEIANSLCKQRAFGIIKQNKDIFICEQMENVKDIKYCYDIFVNKNSNISICDLIANKVAKNICYSKISIFKQDELSCGKITDIQEQSECYMIIGTKEKDVEICKKIIDMKYRDNCYLSIARDTKNRALCDKITEGSVAKGACYNQVP